MKEQDVRQRIERFLKRTAREVVVPASVGLGLALSGCDHTGIQARTDAADTSPSATTDAIVADATLGRDGAANSPDAANRPDLRLPDDVRLSPDTGQPDLPVSIPPYGVILRPDAGVDTSVPDAQSDAGAPDADVPDASADVRAPDARRDARQPDLPVILPPYMPPPPPDAARDVSAVMPPYMMPPPPPYMAPAFASADAARDLPAIEPPYLIAPHAAPITEPPADKSK
jgi:hypothetical protein